MKRSQKHRERRERITLPRNRKTGWKPSQVRVRPQGATDRPGVNMKAYLGKRDR